MGKTLPAPQYTVNSIYLGINVVLPEANDVVLNVVTPKATLEDAVCQYGAVPAELTTRMFPAEPIPNLV